MCKASAQNSRTDVQGCRMGDLTRAKDDIQSARVSGRVVDMVVEVSPMVMVLLVSIAVDGMVETTVATTPTDARGSRYHDSSTAWTHRRECEVVLECAPWPDAGWVRNIKLNSRGRIFHLSLRCQIFSPPSVDYHHVVFQEVSLQLLTKTQSNRKGVAFVFAVFFGQLPPFFVSSTIPLFR